MFNGGNFTLFFTLLSRGGKIVFSINTFPIKTGHILDRVFYNNTYKMPCFKTHHCVISAINQCLQVYDNETKFCFFALYVGVVEGHH
jgi:hypothetical protein